MWRAWNVKTTNAGTAKPFPAACHDNPAALQKELLRVNLQGTLPMHAVVPALPEVLRRYPRIELQICEDDRLIDLVREGIDCVMRAGTLQDLSTAARRLAELEQISCARTVCLKRYGTPTTLHEPDKQQAVNFVSSATGKPMPLEFDAGNGIRPVWQSHRLFQRTPFQTERKADRHACVTASSDELENITIPSK